MSTKDLFEMSVKFGIADSFVFVVMQNKGNTSPYHNLQHLLDVFGTTCLIIEKCEHTRKETVINSFALMEASLFHDFGRSACNADRDNVAYACAIYRQFRKEFSKRPYSEQEVLEVCSLITSTEWPYVKSNEELSLEETILRDADVVPSAHENFLAQAIGLGKEMGNPSVSKWLRQTIEFNSGKFLLPETNELFFEKRKENTLFFSVLLDCYESSIQNPEQRILDTD